MVNGDQGARWENFVATCLLKHVHARIDYHAENTSLCYLQTKEKREVDFALTKDGEITEIIEVKYTNHSIGAGIQYFHQKYGFPTFQIVKELKREKVEKGIQVVGAVDFLKKLDL